MKAPYKDGQFPQSPEDKAKEAYYMDLYLQCQREEQLTDLTTLAELPEDFEFHQEFYQTQAQPSQL